MLRVMAVYDLDRVGGQLVITRDILSFCFSP